MSSNSHDGKAKLAKWALSRFDDAPDTVASIVVVIILVPLGLLGIFGSKLVEDNILSALCAVSSLATIFLYNVWFNQRKLRRSVEQASQDLSVLAHQKSPYSVTGPRISGELAIMLDEAKEWSFRGGSGRWQRERVLPRLSRERNRTVPYRMLILDPTEVELCRKYADYRNTHRVDGSVSTAASVQNELLACIVAGAWYSRMSRISASIYLSQIYSPLRQDISTSMAAVTVADKSQSGLFVPQASWYYESLIDEFKQHCDRSPSVQFGDGYELPSDWRNLSTVDVERVLKASSVNRLDGSSSPIVELVSLSSADYGEICKLVFRGRMA